MWLKGKIPHVLADIRHYCLSLKHKACHDHIYKISGRKHNNLPVCPRKSSDLGHTCQQEQLTEVTLKTLASTSKNNARKEENKNKRMANEKPFALHAIAKKKKKIE